MIRNTVTRRLRALVRNRLASLPEGTVLVVRALPPAASATSVALAADLDACLAHLTRMVPSTAVPVASLGRP